MCGLKHIYPLWCSNHIRHTLRGCVDWNNHIANKVRIKTGHTLRGCVDWNRIYWKIWRNKFCHTLRGCVDWNPIEVETLTISEKSHPAWVCGLKQGYPLKVFPYLRHTLRGCVDWNRSERLRLTEVLSHTLRGCVDWNLKGDRKKLNQAVTPCVGVWIETHTN